MPTVTAPITLSNLQAQLEVLGRGLKDAMSSTSDPRGTNAVRIMELANRQADIAVELAELEMVVSPSEAAIQGDPFTESDEDSEEDDDPGVAAVDYEVVFHYLRHQFPTLQFKSRDEFAPERCFRNPVDDIPGRPRLHRLRVAFRAFKMLLSASIIEWMGSEGFIAASKKLLVEFFADAHCRPMGECPPATVAGLGTGCRTTAMFQLTVAQRAAFHKLYELEVRLAFYRAYTAALKPDHESRCRRWVLTNTAPVLPNEQQIVCGIVAPRSAVATLEGMVKRLDDCTHLKLFGCCVLPSKHVDLKLREEGMMHVSMLSGPVASSPASATIRRVAVLTYHCELALLEGIKDAYSLCCPAALIKTYDSDRRPFRGVISPNEQSNPYYFYAPRFWVQAAHQVDPVELDSFPTTVLQLKYRLKEQLGLPSDATTISIQGYPNNSTAIEPCSRDSPYVYSQPQCWVMRSGQAEPARFVKMPAMPYDFKVPINKEVGLTCITDRISVQGLTDNSMTIEPCTSKAPYVFSEPQYWVRSSTKQNPVLLKESPNLAFELKLAIKQRFRLKCEAEDIIVDNLPEGDEFAPVEPNTRENPYVFSEPQCWVLQSGQEEPVLLDTVPETIYELKRSVKKEFGLACGTDQIIVKEDYSRDGAPPLGSRSNPFVFFQRRNPIVHIVEMALEIVFLLAFLIVGVGSARLRAGIIDGMKLVS